MFLINWNLWRKRSGLLSDIILNAQLRRKCVSGIFFFYKKPSIRNWGLKSCVFFYHEYLAKIRKWVLWLKNSEPSFGKTVAYKKIWMRRTSQNIWGKCAINICVTYKQTRNMNNYWSSILISCSSIELIRPRKKNSLLKHIWNKHVRKKCVEINFIFDCRIDVVIGELSSTVYSNAFYPRDKLRPSKGFSVTSFRTRTEGEMRVGYRWIRCLIFYDVIILAQNDQVRVMLDEKWCYLNMIFLCRFYIITNLLTSL